MPPTYARLFDLFLLHFAEREGKPRRGAQTGLIERYVDELIEAYDGVKIVHMLRDPRDRYLASLELWPRGPGSGRWSDRPLAVLDAAGRAPHGPVSGPVPHRPLRGPDQQHRADAVRGVRVPRRGLRVGDAGHARGTTAPRSTHRAERRHRAEDDVALTPSTSAASEGRCPPPRSRSSSSRPVAAWQRYGYALDPVELSGVGAHAVLARRLARVRWAAGWRGEGWRSSSSGSRVGWAASRDVA